ncbi:MAG: hypothetical protein ACO1RT_05695, partial [Planctomycetaceae bacterium]
MAAWQPLAVATEPPALSESLPSDLLSAGGVIARWTFSRSEDVDFDRWPEGWQRKRDHEHPAYPPVRIAAHDEGLLRIAQAADLRMLRHWPSVRALFTGLPSLPPSIADSVAGKYLRMELDGGWIMVQSPAIRVDPLYRYRLQLSAKSEALVHDHAYAELVFLDASGNALAQHETKKLTGTTSWTKLYSPLIAVPEGAATLAARLRVRPIKVAGEADITGAAGFDDISIQQLPQMQVTTDRRLAVYDAGQRPTISVRVLGLDNKVDSVHFVLQASSGAVLAEQTVPFEQVNAAQRTSLVTATATAPPALSATSPPATAEQATAGVATTEASSLEDSSLEESVTLASIEGTASWELPQLGPGFYRIRSLLGNVEHPWLSDETTLAVLAALPEPSVPGPYGWTLPRPDEDDLDMKRLPDWLKRLSVGVVKYPCWFDPEDRKLLDSTAWLVGRLQEKEIRTIGMLDHPPESALAKIDERERREPYAANLFRDASVWQPLLEPIMTRLTLKVKTWQLGADKDYSFLGRPQLKQSIKDIARDL